jgi:riboflavin biosynthesis pyrimidine reductase
MRQLLPEVVDPADPLELYGADSRPSLDGRPWVMANMVASVDGATTVEGVSGGLGAEGDRMVFSALRTIADVVLVASGTANAERYGPVILDEGRSIWRAERGRPAAGIAVVTGSLGLDLDLPLFAAEHGPRPLILTHRAAPEDRRSALADVAEIVDVGDQTVDLTRAIGELGDRGAGVVLTEGGPGLLGQMAALDLIDELCLTVAPWMAGGDSRRILHQATMGPQRLALDRVLEHDGELHLRYLRLRPA